jgi:hypothetical protein
MSIDARIADLAAHEHLQRRRRLDRHLDLRPQQLGGIGLGDRGFQFAIVRSAAITGAISGKATRPSGWTTTDLFSSPPRAR